MANYDTSVRVVTKVDNSGLQETEKGIEQIKDRLEEAKKKAEALEEAGTVDTQAYRDAKKDVEKWNDVLDKNIAKQKEVAKAVTETTSSSSSQVSVPQTKGDFSSLSDTVEDYETRLKHLRDQGFGFGDKKYDELYVAWKNAVDAEKEYAANLNKLTDKGIAEEEARITSEKEKQAEGEQKIQRIRLNAEVSNQKVVNLLKEQTRLEVRKAELKKAGVTDGYREYDEINARLAQIKKEVDKQKNGFASLGNSARKAFGRVDEGAKKSGGLLKNFTSRLKGIILSLLVFNWITKAFNAMVEGLKEGFNNLVQYSDEYNDAMSQLKSSNTQMKNSIATAFGPIVQMAIPHLVALINYITEASNRVAQFTAVLAGENSWTKAVTVQEDYAEALRGTASAAKKAKGALASFDTLETLNKKDESQGGKTNPKDMFEEVPIENMEITSIAEQFKQMVNAGDWEGLGALLSDKLKKALQGIEWQEVYSNADTFGSGLAAFLNGLVKPSTFKEVGKTTAGSLNTCLHFLNSFGKDFEWGQFGESLSEGLKGFLMEWDAELTGENFSTFASGLLQAATEAIETTGDNDSFEELGQKFVDLICGIQWGDLTWDLINFFVALQDAVGELPADFARGIAEGILKKITGQENLEIDPPEWLNNIIESMIRGPLPVQPLSFVKMILPDEQEEKEQLAQFLGRVYQWLDGDIRNLFTKEKWKELTTGLKEGLYTNWEEFKILWEESGAALWWEEDVAPWFTVEKWAEVASGMSEGISTKWDETSETWKTNIKSWWENDVAPWFTVEKWKTIGENMKKGVYNGFYGIVSKTVDVVNGIISACEGMINNIIGKINTFLRAAETLLNKVPNANVSFGTLENVSFGRVQMPNLPALADGAVIRGGSPFAAVLGDQPLGQTNVETPVSTIEDAVTRGMERYSSGRNMTINLNYDGETFARVALNDILNELDREGYDIDILGGTT